MGDGWRGSGPPRYSTRSRPCCWGIFCNWYGFVPRDDNWNISRGCGGVWLLRSIRKGAATTYTTPTVLRILVGVRRHPIKVGMKVGGGPVTFTGALGMAVQVGVDTGFPVGALESQIRYKIQNTNDRMQGNLLGLAALHVRIACNFEEDR